MAKFLALFCCSSPQKFSAKKIFFDLRKACQRSNDNGSNSPYWGDGKGSQTTVQRVWRGVWGTVWTWKCDHESSSSGHSCCRLYTPIWPFLGLLVLSIWKHVRVIKSINFSNSVNLNAKSLSWTLVGYKWFIIYIIICVNRYHIVISVNDLNNTLMQHFRNLNELYNMFVDKLSFLFMNMVQVCQEVSPQYTRSRIDLHLWGTIDKPIAFHWSKRISGDEGNRPIHSKGTISYYVMCWILT